MPPHYRWGQVESSREPYSRMKARKRRELDLLDFAKAQVPKDCIGGHPAGGHSL